MGMRRDISRLLDHTFDLLVVGAGIQGACIAWDAALRGLSVAVVDRGDFGGATSANSLGIVHGGLRYLAQGDIARMAESIRERSALLRIAPDLVEPLPVLIPTYGSLASGRAALGAALVVNDIVSGRRNRRLRSDRLIPRGRLVSRDECLRLFPWFGERGLTGGALWYDGRLRQPERLTLSFVRSAAERGAVAANYLRVDQLLVRDGEAGGASVTDVDGGAHFQIRARTVVVAAGPWTPGVIARTLGKGDPGPTAGRALAVNIRVDRTLASVAIGARSRNGPDADPVCGGRRYLFAAPHSGGTLLGTWYANGPDVTPEQGVHTLVREFNDACPGLELSESEVSGYQCGWLPLKGTTESGRPTALAERPRVVEHAAAGIRHLLSVEAVKYTTARAVAERVVNWVFRDLGRPSPACQTADVPLVDAAEQQELALPDVQRAVHREMALRLSDILYRRSSLGATARLDRTVVANVARIAGAELGWDSMRQEVEIEEVMQQRGIPAPSGEPVG